MTRRLRTSTVIASAGPVIIGALLGGCTERRIRITSEPPGARVWLNDVEIGETPAEAEFLFHGVYDVRLQLDGYEPVHEGRKVSAPVWEWPGLDLAAEALPLNFSKTHEFHFDLVPSENDALPPEEAEAALINRAYETREQLISDPNR